MINFRCSKCARLLAKIEGKAEIKCPKCKTLNQMDSETYPWGQGDIEIEVIDPIPEAKEWSNLPYGVCIAKRMTVDEVNKIYPRK